MNWVEILEENGNLYEQTAENCNNKKNGGSSESMVLNGNVDGFLIANNTVHDNNNIGIDMIGFEGLAEHPEENDTRNPFEVDQVRNGICRNNTIYNISTEGNSYYTPDDAVMEIYEKEKRKEGI